MTVQDFRDLVRYVMAHPFITKANLTVAGEAVRFDDPSVLKVTVNAGAPGRIHLTPVKGPSRALLRTSVTAPEKMRTRLLLGSGQPLKVWLNGEQVYAGTPGKAAEPDQAGVEVELKEGGNEVKVEVRYSGDQAAVYLRLLDPQRKLHYHDGPR